MVAGSVTEPAPLVTLRHRMTTGKYNHPLSDTDYLGLTVSIILHIALFFIIFHSKPPALPVPTSIDVSIEPPSILAPKKQIVSPTNQPPIKPPEETTRLSDADSRANVEKIQRGDGGGQPGKPQEQPNSPSKPTEKSPQQPPKVEPAKPPTNEPRAKVQEKPVEKAAPSNHKRDLNLTDLKLDDATLALKFGAPQKAPAQPKASNQSQQKLADYQAFSRPPGSGAAFLGSAGINDHLPNLPDGDITLLNAKANQYAGFVRRVAVQVFTQLRTQGWERLSADQLHRLSDFATIEAILSIDGKFLGAKIVETSGSDAFDAVVNQSVKQGASDPNPPPGAQASDGRIHFIFKARSWSQVGVNRRTGGPTEYRWLLLATGLE
jgi:outer membrane biosynthesis protein TonB